jgi:hypothetical protein
MNSFHVLYDGDHWNVTAEGSDETFGIFETRQEAVAGAARILSAYTGSLKIHGTDGMIEEERDYTEHEPP